MATFRPVNTTLAPDSFNHSGDETAPTTPRPSTAPSIPPPPMSRDDATTPTRATFGALASQRPLPASQFPADIPVPESAEKALPQRHRGDARYADRRDPADVEMDDSDGNADDGSDDESVNADGTRSSKKKKSQRFYCTEYPPCNLSFTRSEHLARHIRKHTGERPFQCHCSRRFSRLDNLRQHAQTVHVNEDIPQDSLAATGTRFQRQVRTDRVRPPGSRSRASTAGSQTGPVRGHQRNALSTSSIASTASMYSQPGDTRKRPAPLVMAGEPRQRYSQEIYRADSPSAQYLYRNPSPSGYGTPTSATFSAGQDSPRWAAGLQSPPSSHSRTQSLYAGHRTPGRRLSVPSAGNPFQSPHANSYGPPLLGSMNSSNVGAYSPSSSMISSPTTSTSGSAWSRRDSGSSTTDEAWRRRTWHPETTNFSGYTSRLQNVTTPNYYASSRPPPPSQTLPSNAPPHPESQQAQHMRLPGIESFDPLPPRPLTPVRRQPSPMMIDTPSRAPMPRPPHEPYQERPSSQQWDMGINRLNINPQNADQASSWATETQRAVDARAQQSQQPAQQSVRFEDATFGARGRYPTGPFHQHTISAPPITPKEVKRRGWYHGPVPTAMQSMGAPDPRAQRTSPEDSSSSEGGGVPGTPSSVAVQDINPSIMHSNGYVERQQYAGPLNGYAPYQQQGGAEHSYGYGASQPQQLQQGHGQGTEQVPKQQDSSLLRLEALVAVATSQDAEATAY